MYTAACLVAAFFIAQPCHAYIDPNTTNLVLSGLGSIIAFVVSCVAFVWVMTAGFFRRILRMIFEFGNRNRIILTVAVVLIISCVGLYFEMYGTGVTQEMQKKQHQKRVVVIGIDGMDPVVTRELIAAGRLPHFAALAQKGDFKEMESANPSQSPVVWASMGTGLTPKWHKIFDFIRKQDGTYMPDLALLQKNPHNFLRQPNATYTPLFNTNWFFWEILASQHIKTKVLRWPLTFPAKGKATLLSGLGTPDLLGGLGLYTVYTTAPHVFTDTDVKGHVRELIFSGTTAQTDIGGPSIAGIFGKEAQAKIALMIDRSGPDGTMSLIVEGSRFTLKVGEWSPWIPLSFSMGFSGLGRHVSGMVNFLVVATTPEVHIYMSPIHIDPYDPIFPISQPTDFSKTLAEVNGRSHTLGMSEDTNALGDNVISDDQFIALCKIIAAEAENTFRSQFSKFDEGLFAFVFDTTDRIQHMYWRFRDKNHPANTNPEEARLYQDVIAQFYIRMDAIIGEVMQSLNLEQDILLALSDHGFTSYRRSFHLNSWLLENGYLVTTGDHKLIGGLFQDVDWTRTKAFALGFSQIFINLKGREIAGSVEINDAKALKSELIAKLKAIRDDRDQSAPIEEVYDVADLYGIDPLESGPDLIVGPKPGYRFSWQTAVGGAPLSIFDDNAKRWSGDHCVDYRHVPGVVFASKKISRSARPTVYDIAPTVLFSFGVSPPDSMKGQPLF